MSGLATGSPRMGWEHTVLGSCPRHGPAVCQSLQDHPARNAYCFFREGRWCYQCPLRQFGVALRSMQPGSKRQVFTSHKEAFACAAQGPRRLRLLQQTLWSLHGIPFDQYRLCSFCKPSTSLFLSNTAEMSYTGMLEMMSPNTAPSSHHLSLPV